MHECLFFADFMLGIRDVSKRDRLTLGSLGLVNNRLGGALSGDISDSLWLFSISLSVH